MKKVSIACIAAAGIAAAFFGGKLMRAEQSEPPAKSPEPNLFSFVRSFEGTQPDGNIQVEAGDALVVSAELPRLFDYYLSAVGEKPLESIRAEIERELDARLKPHAAAEAKVLLANYLNYKKALVEVEKNPLIAGGSVEAIRARLHALQETRARFFSASEIQAMFAMEDMRNQDAVARLEISQDKTMSAAQKAEKLAALDTTLPAALREEREAPMQIVRLEESAKKLRSQGASEDEIYRMRATAISPEAAARMADVDREEGAWKSRINDYLAERTRLLGATANYPPIDREMALQQLRQTHFNADEQKRLAAYE
ncbi:MAG TPA: lipase secretion chaperone [Noviherbaspirillum sp.]|nr:lipase secretion chaperone [Noviherbaspirillum sp.]